MVYSFFMHISYVSTGIDVKLFVVVKLNANHFIFMAYLSAFNQLSSHSSRAVASWCFGDMSIFTWLCGCVLIKLFSLTMILSFLIFDLTSIQAESRGKCAIRLKVHLNCFIIFQQIIFSSQMVRLHHLFPLCLSWFSAPIGSDWNIEMQFFECI